jgi:hypothetical protein
MFEDKMPMSAVFVSKRNWWEGGENCVSVLGQA